MKTFYTGQPVIVARRFLARVVYVTGNSVIVESATGKHSVYSAQRVRKVGKQS